MSMCRDATLAAEDGRAAAVALEQKLGSRLKALEADVGRVTHKVRASTIMVCMTWGFGTRYGEGD
jgi:hypothetical protein